MTRTKAEVEAVARAIAWRIERGVDKQGVVRVQLGWHELSQSRQQKYLETASEALAAADAAAPKRPEWFFSEDNYCSYESPKDALETDPLGTTITLDHNATLATQRWQLVPVTAAGDLCPCGKPEGCGDFLGVECQADREEARLWGELPEEWRR